MAAAPFKHRNLPRLLLEARESVMAHTRPGLRDQGLSDQQWREAFLLGPSLSGVLTRMERDGLISRKRDPQDQRRTVVRPTPKGLRRVQTLSTTIEAHYQWMEQHLGKTKLAQLYRLLDEVIALERPHHTSDADTGEDTGEGTPDHTKDAA